MIAMLARLREAERLLAQGKSEQALVIAQRLVQKAPADPGVNSLMVDVLLQMGKAAQAEFFARRALGGAPDAADTHVNLALCLVGLDRPGEARALLEKAVALEPSSQRARLALANTLMDANDAPAAAEHCLAGMAAGPSAPLAGTYAGALLAMGRIEECVAFGRDALRQFPDDASIASGLALSMTYLPGVDPDVLAEAHREYGRILDRLRPAPFFAPPVAAGPERRIRVGLVSPDFRQHSVSFFIEPFLEHHDRDRFEVYAYSSTRHPDAVTRRLRGHAAAWRETPNLNEMQLASRIREDNVDIAIDLAGHTLGNNLPAFNLRPAPVQVTYCGYPDTTGLTSIDYRIVDSLTDPPGPDTDARATEKLWRLDPCFLCYRPSAAAPEPAIDESGGVVFGSFNAGRKINDRVIDAWTRLLGRVPGSRLILKSFDFSSPDAAARVVASFARAGADASRIEVLGATPTLEAHLALYRRVHVALDAWPYNGTTTTCEALWMGVPVVSLAGRTHAGRVGASLLSCVGVPELVAGDEESYLHAAASLALDTGRVRRYRTELRPRMRASALCDAPGFAARFSAALRAMWRGACARP